uniref:Uncharacterized protein n=1 Tax=Arundo donax TaxID=35708 RepID=A0A0A9G5J2_ARUDO
MELLTKKGSGKGTISYLMKNSLPKKRNSKR